MSYSSRSNDRTNGPLTTSKHALIKDQAMSSADEIFVEIPRDKLRVSSTIESFEVNLSKKEGCVMAIMRPFWPTRNSSVFGELDRMRRDMDRLFGGISGRSVREPMAGVFPLTNVTEDTNNYYVRAELPGIKGDDLDISVTGEGLSISGERRIPEEKKDASYHRREREAGKFSRMLSFPGQVDTGKVEASCADGILTVVLPKAEAAKPRQISVKAV
jgi:HSP20 family protein